MVPGLRLIVSLFGLAASIGVLAQNPEPPERLLFVGNSFTFIHDGVANHVRALAASGTPARTVQADSRVSPGATLRIHYGRSEVHDAIRNGAYDVVILQEDIPELTEHRVEPFFEYARLLDREIRDSGARTVFFMTWPYERLNWIDLDEIMQAHREISTELGAIVAPVGVAFERSLAQRPDLNMLLEQDREHETIHGIYLAASVIYSTLFDRSPEASTYVPEGITAEEAAFLQRIAWQTVQEWQVSP